MDKEYIRLKFIELISLVLDNKIDRPTAAKLMRKLEGIKDIDYRDNLLSHAYFALDLLDYEYCTSINTELTYIKECLEGKREYNKEEEFQYIIDGEERICRLIPGLKGDKIPYEDYDLYTPEKFEYYNGVMFGDKIKETQLLTMLMYNIGIENVIKLAPKDIWEEALKKYDDRLAELRQKAIMDKIDNIEGAREEEIKEGFKIGVKKRTIEVAKNLLDVLDEETIAAKTGLSMEEVMKLKNEK